MYLVILCMIYSVSLMTLNRWTVNLLYIDAAHIDHQSESTWAETSGNLRGNKKQGEITLKY